MSFLRNMFGNTSAVEPESNGIDLTKSTNVQNKTEQHNIEAEQTNVQEQDTETEQTNVQEQDTETEQTQIAKDRWEALKASNTTEYNDMTTKQATSTDDVVVENKSVADIIDSLAVVDNDKARIESVTTSNTGAVRSLKVTIQSGGVTYDMQLPDISSRVSIANVKQVNTPSKYVTELRSCIHKLATLIISDKMNTLETLWNMAIRNGENSLQLYTVANGYYDTVGYHSYEEGARTSGLYKYPLDIMLLGIDEYEKKYNEHKDSNITSTKKIEVNIGELKRFRSVTVTEIIQTVFRKVFDKVSDTPITITPEFTSVLEEDSAVAIGYWTVTMSW